MRKISADILYPIASAPIKNGVIVIDEQGIVLEIGKRDDYDISELEIHTGVLVPGFVNAHCHLELSHMKAKVDTGTGLLPFLNKVVTFRDIAMEDILDAIEKGDREMHDNGIVAVGDISNKTDTTATKEKSAIRYYSFVEMFDFLSDAMAEKTFEQYMEVYQEQSDTNGNKKSAVPHAPYTVSKSLFSKINTVNKAGSTVSIHNQETAHEDELFLTKTGGFIDFYNGFNIPLDGFEASGKTAIHYAIENMNLACKTLFVHNTMTSRADIHAAKSWNEQVYWATCPNANLYIENRLPNYQHFLDEDAKVCIGTDSLTSNWQLCILDEMKTIQKYQSYVPLETLFRWATLNGAEALGYDDEIGSFEIGKRPGVNLVQVDEGGKIQGSTKKLS